MERAVDPDWVEWANRFLVSWPMMVILAVLWLGLLGTTLWLRRTKVGDRAPARSMLTWVCLLGAPVVVELVLRDRTLSWVTYILVLLTWVLLIWHSGTATASLTDTVLLLFSRRARERRREEKAARPEYTQRGEALDAALHREQNERAKPKSVG